MTQLPKFSSEQEESAFWDTHDFTDFLDETEEVDVESVVQPPGRIMLDLDPDAITQLETIAEQQGINYRILVRRWVLERLTTEAKAS